MSSKNTLFTSLVICAAVVGAKTAQAEGFKFGGGNGNNGNSKSSVKINFGGNNSSYNHLKNGGNLKKYPSCHDNFYPHYRVRYIEPVRPVYNQCYHPQFCCCYVFPGDTWYSISKRAYGVTFLHKHIASYNGLSMNSRLVPGQMLRLPVVNSNGSLAVSNAPMPAPFAPQGIPFAAQKAQLGPQNPTFGPQSSPMAAQGLTNGSAPRVAAGSTLMLDGESLGTEKGSVRLRMGSLTLPVEVIEWTANSVKVELPQMELSRPVKASLEILRADGSLASNSGIELTPAATRLALGN